ncbi:hypothetical protein [Bacillus thuringiensis]|uniref:hypothetical protein n=1 Tax=Bacillus thuringiensis TaxID=1428 RepID=UPI000BF52B9B|nr:hypothetical protein [Bacillus thuringiensis]PEV64108.1 hypothetical protein CN434_25205 [Bacillus thuringiensis]
MTKRVFLLVSGDGDFDAMNFEKKFDKQEVYENMLKDGVTRTTLTHEEEWGVDNIYVSIHEFDVIDSEFIGFMVTEFLDYDYLKAKNFYEVEARG